MGGVYPVGDNISSLISRLSCLSSFSFLPLYGIAGPRIEDEWCTAVGEFVIRIVVQSPVN